MFIFIVLIITFLNATNALHQVTRKRNSLFNRKVNAPCFAQSQTVGDVDPNNSVARIATDIPRLYEWIHLNQGEMKAKVVTSTDGWSLSTDSEVKKNDILIRIPKKMTISSDLSTMSTELSENASNLMNSLEPSSWRARLAIAVLSERAKQRSFFASFIRNLPAEFRGMPMFYTSNEERAYLQDNTLITKVSEVARFLKEFSEQVLQPLCNTKEDPFNSEVAPQNLMDVYGWAFAIASSRALRPNAIEGYPRGNNFNAVMIPGIDIAQHSFTPSCMVIDGGDEFILMTTQDLPKDAALTINYGPMTNDEFLIDYGFTVDNNPNDNIQFQVDSNLINYARSVMRQSDFTFPTPVLAAPSTVTINKISARSIGINQRHDLVSDQALSLWQTFWLRTLSLYAPYSNPTMTVDGMDNFKEKELLVDGRLWAMLRVMYSDREDDLRRHGYDPFILQSPGSILSPPVEAHVIKTLIGMLLIILRAYGTDVERDIDHLTRGIKNVYSIYKAEAVETNIIRRDCLKILRSIMMSTNTAIEEKSTVELINTINPETNKLTPNLMTAMQFRIHKKRLIIRVIRQLIAMHQQLVDVGKEMNESNIEALSVFLQQEEVAYADTKEQNTGRLLKFIDSNYKNGGQSREDDRDSKSRRVLKTATSLTKKWVGKGVGL